MNRIRELREQRGLTQTELSFRIRVAQPNLCAVECGRRKAWAKIRKSLAEALHTSESELFPS